MTATATKTEESSIKDLCDMTDPCVIRQNPVTNNHLYIKLKRPPSINGFRGKGDGKTSTLDLLQVLVLDKFVDCVKNGEDPKVTMIFVQSFEDQNVIKNFLISNLKTHLQGKVTPWICNNSAVGKITKIENDRKVKNGDIKLYITTSVMMCGVDLPRVDLIIITRPFSHISSIIQAGGRGGRILRDGNRRRVIVYLLYNASDIRSNSTRVTEPVRRLYSSSTCIKSQLHAYFSTDGEEYDENPSWCCNFH